MQAKRLAIIALASSLALILAFAYAHVMAYYPVNVTVVPSQPKVIFAPGSNAGATDIDGSTIGVTIGANNTRLTLTIHPTYETTYYENVSIIENTGTTSYNVSIKVETPMNLPAGSEAYLIVYDKGTSRDLSGWPVPSPSGYVAMIDLTQTGTTNIGVLSAGGVWELDLLIYIPEGSSPTTTSALLHLISTPS